MANILPSKLEERISWFEARIADWTTNAVAIGLTTGQTTALSALITSARNAFEAAEDARMLSKDATYTQNQAAKTLTLLGTGFIATIKAKAESTLDNSVYTKAHIPAPTPPTPSGIPDAPTDLSGYINEAGYVELAWKGSLAHSTYFTVKRRLANEGAFSIVGTVGAKKWMDTDLPGGSISATYTVQAHRGTKESIPSQQFNVISGIPQSVVTLKVAA